MIQTGKAPPCQKTPPHTTQPKAGVVNPTVISSLKTVPKHAKTHLQHPKKRSVELRMDRVVSAVVRLLGQHQTSSVQTQLCHSLAVQPHFNFFGPFCCSVHEEETSKLTDTFWKD